MSLEGETVAQCLSSYMRQSEQLHTQLWLECNAHSAGGLLLQQMPTEGGKTQSAVTGESVDIQKMVATDPLGAWQRLGMLSNTLRPGELLNTHPEKLIDRLFWQEAVKTLNIRQAVFYCTCSREKVTRMLKILGADEIQAALGDDDTISVNCDYCNTRYEFDAIDCAELLASLDAPDSQPMESYGTFGADASLKSTYLTIETIFKQNCKDAPQKRLSSKNLKYGTTGKIRGFPLMTCQTLAVYKTFFNKF